MCVKNKKDAFFFFVNIGSPQQHREIKKKPQGVNFERDKGIKMIELIQNTDDDLQIIDSVFFKKGCKVLMTSF